MIFIFQHLQKLGNKEDTTLKARIEEKRGRKRKQGILNVIFYVVL